MPLPVINFIYRVTLNWLDSVGGQTAANVLHFESFGGSTASVFAALDTNVDPNMFSYISSAAAVTHLSILPLNGTSPTDDYPVVSSAWVGQAAGDYAPNLAGIVKFTTGLRGRDNRGRLYMPFISENDAAKGILDADDVSQAQTGWDAFKGSAAAAGSTLVVASYDRAHGGAGAHATTVGTITVENICGTQRKRQTRLR